MKCLGMTSHQMLKQVLLREIASKLTKKNMLKELDIVLGSQDPLISHHRIHRRSVVVDVDARHADDVVWLQAHVDA